MKLIAVTYSGRKPYRDRTALRNDWLPGDVKRVPEREAKILLRFAEFDRADEAEATDKPGDAEAMVAGQAQREQDERNATESMLLLVDSMDKDALEAYAKNYSVDLDKRRSLASLRQEVNNLIELHGAV